MVDDDDGHVVVDDGMKVVNDRMGGIEVPCCCCRSALGDETVTRVLIPLALSSTSKCQSPVNHHSRLVMMLLLLLALCIVM